MDNARIPVTFVTGFLGSGKTTLIRRVLGLEGFSNALVIVNEFGEVGIDQDLLEASANDAILMANGCFCRTIRGDLIETLLAALNPGHDARQRAFDRVVVETSGVADPAQLSAYLFSDPKITAHYRLGQVITTCDAVAGALILDRYPESRRQARVADRLLITKGDLAPETATSALKIQLRALNPTAPITAVEHGALPPDKFWELTDDEFFRDMNVGRPAADHSDRFTATVLTAVRPLNDAEIESLVDVVTAYAGPHLLRLKGVFARAGRSDCVVIQASLRVVHPPELPPTGSIRRPACGRMLLITEGGPIAPLMIKLAPLGVAPLYLGAGWTSS